MSVAKLQNILDHPNSQFYKGKYVLVEQEFKDRKKYSDKKVGETKNCIYYASAKGNIYSICKSNKKKKILAKAVNPQRNLVQVKIGTKTTVVKNIIAQTFLGSKVGDIVHTKNGDIYNCSIDNLEIVKREVHNGKNGRKANAKPVAMYKKGKVVKKWECIKDCANELYMCPNAIRGYCNGEVQNPQFDIRFI